MPLHFVSRPHFTDTFVVKVIEHRKKIHCMSQVCKSCPECNTARDEISGYASHFDTPLSPIVTKLHGSIALVLIFPLMILMNTAWKVKFSLQLFEVKGITLITEYDTNSISGKSFQLDMHTIFVCLIFANQNGLPAIQRVISNLCWSNLSTPLHLACSSVMFIFFFFGKCPSTVLVVVQRWEYVCMRLFMTKGKVNSFFN